MARSLREPQGADSIKNAIFSLIRAGMRRRLISERARQRGREREGCARVRLPTLSCKYPMLSGYGTRTYAHRYMHMLRERERERGGRETRAAAGGETRREIRRRARDRGRFRRVGRGRGRAISISIERPRRTAGSC